MLPHTHNYVFSGTVQPSCTTNGYSTYTCSCGESYTSNYVSSLGHSWDSGTITTQPTETTTGIKTFRCTRCGTTRTETVPKLDHIHQYSKKITQPTCTTMGYTTYTCVCGDSYTSDYVSVLGHNYSANVIPATCTTAGYTSNTCTRCGQQYTSNNVPALGHNYQNNVCTRCGDVKEPDTVAVTGVTLNKTALTLTVGEQATLTATVMPSNATNKQVNWTSSNSSAATVSGGTVTAVQEGSAVITVRTADGNKTATCSVTVTKPASPPEPPVDPENADVIFSMDQVSGKPGDTVYVGLYIDSKENINTVGVYLVNYPSDVMTFAGFENPGAIVTESITQGEGVDSEKGAIAFGYVGASKYSGKICDLKFVINEDAQETNAEIQMNAIVKNGSNVMQTYVQPGTVSIKNYKLGDLNGDEIVDISDAVALLQYSIFPEFYPLNYSGNVDFNHDGTIDIGDAVLLLQYSIFPEFYPLS